MDGLVLAEISNIRDANSSRKIAQRTSENHPTSMTLLCYHGGGAGRVNMFSLRDLTTASSAVDAYSSVIITATSLESALD